MMSVVNQSFRDFEYIIIDGASSDGSVDEIKRIGKDYSFIVWSSEKDTGVFNAMNKGIQRANGDYLLFLNSGDFLVDDNVLDNVFSEGYFKEDFVIGKLRVTSFGKQIWILSPQPHYSLDYFYHGSVAHQASFIKKDLFKRYGLYREDLRIMGDWEFAIRTLILNDCSIRPVDVIVSDYNIEGLSGREENAQLIETEKSTIFRDLHLCNIITDYKRWDAWHQKHRAMEWATSKAYFRKPIEWVYSFSVWLVNKKKKYLNE